MEHLAEQLRKDGNGTPPTLTLPDTLAEELRKFAHVASGTKLRIGGRKRPLPNPALPSALLQLFL